MCVGADGPDADQGDLARRILADTGVRGGLIVHLGCGDGRRTAAFRAGDAFVVHGLDTDAEAIEQARERLESLGVYGPVSVDTFDGRHLPYADNLVNLVVVECAIRDAGPEIVRALCPGGVAVVREKGNEQWIAGIPYPARPVPRVGDGLVSFTKPVPPETDQWTHFLHDASGNAVSADRRVAPPRHIQWDGAPRWSRSHETDMSITAAVSAGGRIFHTLDEGPIGVHETPLATRRLPDKCSLVARDAFNGIILWKRPLPGWGSAAWDRYRFKWDEANQLWSSPYTLPRRLVGVGDKLYVTLGFRASVSELDAATGDTLREFRETADTEEILHHNGTLVLRVLAEGKSESITALDLESGKTLWRNPAENVTGLTLAASGQRVCYHDGEGIHAIDLRAGRELWLATPEPNRLPGNATLVMHGQTVLFADGLQTHAFSAGDGTFLWKRPARGSFRGTTDVFVANGLVWMGTLATQGVDIETGEPAAEIDPGHLFTAGHHSRCYRAKATERFLLWSKRGVEFLDLLSSRHTRHDWFRGTCRYGVLPANGLLYAPAHPCFCYPGVKLAGFNALSAEDGAVAPERRREPHAVRGPAFGAVPSVPARSAGDWPTYRHDNARSGCGEGTVPARLRESWRMKPGGKLTPPVLAGDRLFVAGADVHTLYCIDPENGRGLWRCTAGGPVDSPPTVHGQRVLFGCTDGSVYCLRASDGELVWRFHAAPYDKRIVSYGRLESAWPVHGSVLAADGVIYFAAGRSSFLDGGIYLYGLDAATGEIRHRAHLDGPWPDLAEPSDRAHEMDGGKNDVLVSNGHKLFLTQNVFDMKLSRLEAPQIAKHGARKMDRHLMATGGFLDDSGFDRLFWMYAERWPGLYVAVGASKAGQILVFDENTVYGLHTFNSKFSRSPYSQPGSEGYELFADDVGNEPLLEESQARRERGGMTRGAPPKWSVRIPVRARAMVLAGTHLLLAGPPDVIDPRDPYGAFEGRKGGELWAVSTVDGRRIAAYRLEAPPVFDGLIAAHGKLFMTMADGTVCCWSRDNALPKSKE
jgi:outer membrane protein assembly factor BamB